MRQIRHELKIRARRLQVLEALTNPSALERWHGASVSGGPHEWTLSYPDGPSFRWRVLSANPDRVVWRCEDGPGHSKGSQVTFELSDADKERCLVQLAHHEWREDDEKLSKCNTLWAVLLGRLQHEAEGFHTVKR